MKTTNNYELKKPEASDYISIDDLNENMDRLDYHLKDLSDKNDKATAIRNVTLKASGWSSAYPYKQTVSVSNITAASNVKVIGVYIPDGYAADQVKEKYKAAGYLMSHDNATGAGTITFYAYKKPTTDLTVIVEGG